MLIFLSIGQIAGELELPPLNVNTKQFLLYGTTLTHYLPTIHIWIVCCNSLPGQHKGMISHSMVFTGNLDPNTSHPQH